jgi:exodeoxyribonuclease VIII
MTNGTLIDGMTNKEYRSAEGMNQSALKIAVKKTFGHMQWRMAHPKPDTKDMKLGRLAHTLALQPEMFALEYVQALDLPRRKEVDKRKHAEFERENRAREIVTAEMIADASAMVDSLKTLEDNKDARDALFMPGARREVSAFWRDEATGVLCKARIDVLIDAGDHWIVLDYKTAADLREHKWRNAMAEFGYGFQGACYTEGVKAITGKPAVFWLAAQEKEEPYFCRLLAPVGHRTIEVGRLQYRRALTGYKQCIETGVWPAYPSGGMDAAEYSLGELGR